jgi:hypothetical protein
MNGYKTKNMKTDKILWALRGLTFMVLFFGLMTLAAMFLWNQLVTDLFGLPAINFYQMLGLLILGRLITGGFGWRGWYGTGGSYYRRHQYLREKWQNMTEEERQEWKKRWHYGNGCYPEKKKEPS